MSTASSSDEQNDSWLCADSGHVFLFQNLFSAVLFGTFFVILCPLYVHFLGNLQMCCCSRLFPPEDASEKRKESSKRENSVSQAKQPKPRRVRTVSKPEHKPNPSGTLELVTASPTPAPAPIKINGDTSDTPAHGQQPSEVFLPAPTGPNDKNSNLDATRAPVMAASEPGTPQSAEQSAPSPPSPASPPSREISVDLSAHSTYRPVVAIARDTRAKSTSDNCGGRPKNAPARVGSKRLRVAYAVLETLCISLLFLTALGKFTCLMDSSSVNPTFTLFLSLVGHLMLYACFGLSVTTIFTLRLRETFRMTQYEVSDRSLKFIVTAAVSSPIIVLSGVVMYVRGNAIWAYILCFSGDFLYCGLAACLLYMFVSRLRGVAATTTVARLNGGKGDTALLFTIIKLSIVASVTIVTTMLTSSIVVMGLLSGNVRSVYVVLNFFICCDTFVNAVFFMLQFSFNHRSYWFLCSKCHKTCKTCCQPNPPTQPTEAAEAAEAAE